MCFFLQGQLTDMDEKLDSVQLEYTYLLTSQLESQRNYYEEKLARLQGETKLGVRVTLLLFKTWKLY